MKKTKQQNSIDISKVDVLYDNIIVQPIRPESDGGLAQAHDYEDKPAWGFVVNVGTGRVFDNGTIQSLKVKVGDTIMFQQYSAQKIRHSGEDYLLIKEEDVFFIS